MTNILFDTNAAREFVSKVKIEDLEKYAEERASTFDKKGLKLLVSPIVVMELLCHLVDDKDKDFSISFKAIKAMMLVMEHQRKDGRHEIMSPSELLIANDVYNMRIESREIMYSQIMSLAETIAHGGINEIPDLHTIDGGTLKTYVDGIEKEFSSQIRSVCHEIENNAKNHNVSFKEELNNHDSEVVLVTYFSRTTYSLLMNEGKVPDFHNFLPEYAPITEKTTKMCIEFIQYIERGNDVIIRRYPAFLRLAKEVVRRIKESGNQITDERLRNFIWDISLMFHINDHTIEKQPVRFVTSDKAMIVASGAFHDSNDVMNYSEFETWLKQ